MQNKNYIMIQGWMINDLKLKGNELILYALIYGFSQDGESEYYGSIDYRMKALGLSNRAVIDITERLIKKGLVERTSDSHFKTIKGVKKVHTPCEESSQVGCEESSHINNNTNNNIHTKVCVSEELEYIPDRKQDIYNLAAQISKKGGKVWLGDEHEGNATPKPKKKAPPKWRQTFKWRDNLIDYIENEYNQPTGYRPTQYGALKKIRALIDKGNKHEVNDDIASELIKTKYDKLIKQEWLDGVVDFNTLLVNWHKIDKMKTTKGSQGATW